MNTVISTMVEFSNAAYMAYEMSMMSERAQAMVTLAFDALIAESEESAEQIVMMGYQEEKMEERIYELEEENEEYEARCEAYEEKLSSLDEEIRCAVENAFDTATVSDLQEEIFSAVTEIIETLEPVRRR